MSHLASPQNHTVSTTVLHIEYPHELLLHSDMSKKDVEQLAREALFVRLYERGYISSGKAAELLGISRRTFLDILGQYHVSEFDEEMNLKQELSNATAACCMQHQSID